MIEREVIPLKMKPGWTFSFISLLISNKKDEIKKNCHQLHFLFFSACLCYTAHDINNHVNIGTDKEPYIFTQIAETASGISGKINQLLAGILSIYHCQCEKKMFFSFKNVLDYFMVLSVFLYLFLLFICYLFHFVYSIVLFFSKCDINSFFLLCL